MLIILSPSKNVDFGSRNDIQDYTKPLHLDKANFLSSKLKEFSLEEIKKLMNVSLDLALNTQENILLWQKKIQKNHCKQAILSFKGEAFTSLDADHFETNHLQYAQEHLRILSGLYGVLRPLDMIYPYRLEMGTKWSFDDYKNLYDYWRRNNTDHINKAIVESGSNFLINLASDEYFKSLYKKEIQAPIITPIFKVQKNDQTKTVAIWSKRGRGAMTKFVIKNKIEDPETLKAFDEYGFAFDPQRSQGNEMIFIKEG